MVTGADGLIGQKLCEFLRLNKFFFNRTSRRKGLGPEFIYFDLMDEKSWSNIPDDLFCVYFLAAITATDLCENSYELAYKVNVEQSERFIDFLKSRSQKIILPSTNMVFDGVLPYPSLKQEQNPMNKYGLLKALLEKKVANNDKVTIVRLTKLSDTLLPLLKSWAKRIACDETIYPFTDMYCSPLDLHEVVKIMFDISNLETSLTYHISGDRNVSYLEIAEKLLIKLSKSNDLISSVTAKQRLGKDFFVHENSTLGMMDNPFCIAPKLGCDQALDLTLNKLFRP